MNLKIEDIDKIIHDAKYILAEAVKICREIKETTNQLEDIVNRASEIQDLLNKEIEKLDE